jgi:hypothetical protein
MKPTLETPQRPQKPDPPGSGASSGSVEWVDCEYEQPPEFEIVLMWYCGTDRIAPWAVVDKLHNRTVRHPDYWARIKPPNGQADRPAGRNSKTV